MGVLDLLSRLVGGAGGDDGPAVGEEERRLAAAAESRTVTPEALARSGQRTDRPVTAYLDEGEEPRYLLRGSELLVADEETEETVRHHPTREMVVVVTDRRVVFVQGGRISDDIVEVPLEDVVEAYVDDASLRNFLIVEASHEADEEDDEEDEGPEEGIAALGIVDETDRDAHNTFFADVTLQGDPTAVYEAADYVEARAAERR